MQEDKGKNKKQSSIVVDENQLKALVAVTNRSNSFALELLNGLNGTYPNKSIVISPLSLQVALGLVYTGSAGKTADEIASIFTLPTDKNITLLGYSTLVSILKDPSINLALKIFIEKSIGYKEDFNKNASSYFDSEIDKIHIHSNTKDAINSINNWVKKKSKNKIKIVVNDGDLHDKIDMVVVNAIHYRANWKEAFSEGATCPDTFFLNNGESVDIDMMFDSDEYRFMKHSRLQAKIIELPYEGCQFSMFIILPNENNGLDKLIQAVSKIKIENELKSLKSCAVDLTLPKFTIAETVSFKEILKPLGITEMFDSGKVDFSGISDKKIADSEVIQKAYIVVDERGPPLPPVVTSVGLGTSAMTDDDEDSEQFKANHPFMFFIAKTKPNEILIYFIGKFTGK